MTCATTLVILDRYDRCLSKSIPPKGVVLCGGCGSAISDGLRHAVTSRWKLSISGECTTSRTKRTNRQLWWHSARLSCHLVKDTIKLATS